MTGNIGMGLVKGFGLKRGAPASSVAHDAHNIICANASDRDMFIAIKEVERLQGGMVVAAEGKVRASLALPIAGLLSTEPMEKVAAGLKDLQRTACSLGSSLPVPFTTLSFLALPTIPETWLTDKGLVDVTRFQVVTGFPHPDLQPLLRWERRKCRASRILCCCSDPQVPVRSPPASVPLDGLQVLRTFPLVTVGCVGLSAPTRARSHPPDLTHRLPATPLRADSAPHSPSRYQRTGS